jgi:hypothetical protein
LRQLLVRFRQQGSQWPRCLNFLARVGGWRRLVGLHRHRTRLQSRRRWHALLLLRRSARTCLLLANALPLSCRLAFSWRPFAAGRRLQQ